jgi:Transposase DDE domain
MRRFGRQCRGQGKILVTVVRQTEQQLLQLGSPIAALAQAAQHGLQRITHLAEPQRDRLAKQLQTAMEAHHAISTQSRRLTQGKRLHHCKIVNAYDGTVAPILKGKSNCPAQFGRKPGLLSEPTTGFIFATRVPAGNPSDPSYVLPMIAKVQEAIDRVSLPRRLAIHSVAGDLGVNDAALRQALHARGILTVGIPQTVAPIPPSPTQEEVRWSLTEAGLHRKRTPHQVHLAFACGHSRPVVESHIASLLSRGAGHVRYKGLQGAVVQLGMTVIAHNGAAMVRIRQLRLSKRAQKFRRLLGLRHRNVKQINSSKN